MADLTRPDRRSPWRRVAILASGFVLGALLTQLATLFLPESAAREFFTTTVSASLGPVSLDLWVLALTVGPLAIRVNVFTVVGILLVALFARRLL
ncbi:MAG: DUF4321 domain-containing protein [Gemmatimonadetes bacterium]|nr:DUF4321 domain-containing protein [Gemmatimonadota bacterium]